MNLLDEIDAQLKVSTPGPWAAHSYGNEYTMFVQGPLEDSPLGIQGYPVVASDVLHKNASLIAGAPTNLRHLVRLLRIVVNAPCEVEQGPDLDDGPYPACPVGPMHDLPHERWCFPCRIRKELELVGSAAVHAQDRGTGGVS